MLFVAAIMAFFAMYGLALFMVAESVLARWALKAATTVCIFAVIGTVLPAFGLGTLSPVPIALGTYGTFAIAVLAVVKGTRGFLEGSKRLLTSLIGRR